MDTFVLLFESSLFVLLISFNCGLLDDSPSGELCQKEPNEYCSGDTFSPKCSFNEVIVINEATYGRSSADRSFPDAEQQTECTSNFTEHLDTLCSGRRSCSVKIPDPAMDRINRCTSTQKTSLYASYGCIRVAGISACNYCRNNGHAKVTGEHGYIASIVSDETQNSEQCGSSHCPWLIEVLPGQSINVTILDFTVALQQQVQKQTGPPQRPGVPSSSRDRCPRLVLIKERANPKESPVCGGRVRRRHLYTSVSNRLEVQVTSQDVYSGKGHFLIHYEAVSCPDVVPPKNSRMKRMHDRCEIDCPGTTIKWLLQCVDNKWVGEIGECPQPQPQLPLPQNESKPLWSVISSLPLNVLITLVIAVTVIVGVIIITTGIVCLKKNRYKSRHSRPDSAIYAATCSEFEFRQDLIGANSALVPKTNVPATSTGVAPTAKPRRPSADPLMPVRDNTYAVDRCMESRPLPAIPDSTPQSSMQRDHLNRVMVQVHPSVANAESINSNQARPTIVCRGLAIGAGKAPAPPPAHRNHVSAGNVGASVGNVQGDNHHYFILDPDVLVEEPATHCSGQSMSYRSAESQTSSGVGRHRE